MKKALLCILVMTLLLTIFSACSTGDNGTVIDTEEPTQSTQSGEPSEQSHEGLLVGYCPPTFTDQWLKTIGDKVTAIIEGLGGTVVTSEADFSIDNQIQQMENYIAMGCDIIIAQPVNVEAYEDVVTKARNEGIKVIFMADEPSYEADGSYLTEPAEMGIMIAEMAIAWLDKTYPDAEAGSIKVAALTLSSRGSPKLRSESMIERILEDERCVLVYQKDEISLTDEGINAINEALALDRDLKIVLCWNDALAIGANSAIMADGGVDMSSVAIFGGASSSAAQELVAQSETNESAFRGLIDQGDDYFTKLVDVCLAAYDNRIPVNAKFYSPLIPVNTVGYESAYSPPDTVDLYD